MCVFKYVSVYIRKYIGFRTYLGFNLLFVFFCILIKYLKYLCLRIFNYILISIN